MQTTDTTTLSERIPQQQSNPFGSQQLARQTVNAVADAEQARAIAETQGAMIMAQRFPRNPIAAMDRILNACTRQTLAEGALYTYARGGTDITGPSIRLAETLAQNWGNIQFGIRELEQRGEESTVETFAWDVETNTRQVKVFQVRHERHTRQGVKKLSDPRDVYELVANQGARRLRACILGIIPGDVVEAAVAQCDTTLRTKANVTPELIASLIEKFSEYHVGKDLIEKRIQRRIEAMTPAQVVALGKIYNSLKDGMSSASEWFEVDSTEIKKANIPSRAPAPIPAEATKAEPQPEPKVADASVIEPSTKKQRLAKNNKPAEPAQDDPRAALLAKTREELKTAGFTEFQLVQVMVKNEWGNWKELTGLDDLDMESLTNLHDDGSWELVVAELKQINS